MKKLSDFRRLVKIYLLKNNLTVAQFHEWSKDKYGLGYPLCSRDSLNKIKLLAEFCHLDSYEVLRLIEAADFKPRPTEKKNGNRGDYSWFQNTGYKELLAWLLTNPGEKNIKLAADYAELLTSKTMQEAERAKTVEQAGE